LPEFLLPFSNSQRLFRPTLAPFVVVGLGVAGISCTLILDPAGPRGLGEPYECLRDPSNPAPPIAFCRYGVAPGENGEPDLPPLIGLRDSGELGLLPGDALNGVEARAYLGGVTYCEPGVGGLEVGGRPNSFL
jgi:hypothetical protein